eukprot:5722184-Prymnesium_polylepis.1
MHGPASAPEMSLPPQQVTAQQPALNGAGGCAASSGWVHCSGTWCAPPFPAGGGLGEGEALPY